MSNYFRNKLVKIIEWISWVAINSTWQRWFQRTYDILYKRMCYFCISPLKLIECWQKDTCLISKTFPTSLGGMIPLTVLWKNRSRGCMVRQREPCAETQGQGSLSQFCQPSDHGGKLLSLTRICSVGLSHTWRNIEIYQHKACCKSSVFLLPPNSLAAQLT